MENLPFHKFLDERWLYYQFSLHHVNVSLLGGWENVLFELGKWKGGSYLLLIFSQSLVLLTWVPRSVTVSAEYVLVNSHQRHRGSLVVAFAVEGFRRETIFTGSKAQFPGLSSHHNGSKVICELPWITSIALKNLGTWNNMVFCWKIAKWKCHRDFVSSLL